MYLSQGSSRTGTHGNAVPVFLYNGNVDFRWFFSVYRTPVVNCNFPWKSYTSYRLLTLKQRTECTKMHHCQIKNQRGARPSPQTSPPLRRGIPPPQTPTPRRLRRSAFSFLFIYDSNTGLSSVCLSGCRQTFFQIPYSCYSFCPVLTKFVAHHLCTSTHKKL